MINIDEVLAEVIERLDTVKLNRLILFGSFANGNPNENSDIDLYIVTDDNFIPKTWQEKMILKMKISHAIRDLKTSYDFDLIVHTKAMYEKFRKTDSLFSKEIIQNGRVLIG